MERIAERHGNSITTTVDIEKVLETVEAYELTGLTPEQISLREDDIKFLQRENKQYREEILKLREELSSYREAEKQGLLKRLPCNIGDNIWMIVNTVIFSENTQSIKIISAEVVEIRSNKLHGIWCIANSKHAQYDFAEEEIGKTVFLTREVAEQALRGSEGE
jgi:hypothetical protein